MLGERRMANIRERLITPAYQYKININSHILFMDKIIQSRINRSLVIHGLQNLVFEKRQRKNIEQPPLPYINHQPDQKITPNKPPKNQSKKGIVVQDESKKIIQNKTSFIKKNPQKRLVSSNNKKKLVKKYQSSDEEDSRSLSEENEKIQSVQEDLKSVKKYKKKVISKQNQNKNNLVGSSKIQKKQKEQELEQQQGQMMKPSQINLSHEGDNNGLSKKTRGRPKKQQFQNEKDHEQNNILKPIQEQKVPEPVKIQVKDQPKTHLVNLDCTIKNEQFERQQPEQNNLQLNDKSMKRQRRTKTSLYKSYNQNDLGAYSEEFEEQEKEERKKKKIYKNYKNKPNNRGYSLNRIFRKEAKRIFPTFSLNIDLKHISFPSIIKQFGVFDLIHFSLPLSYLCMNPQIMNLIEKGFIFIWADQGQTQIGYHLMNRWGFDIIDQIVWIKSSEEECRIEANNIDPCNMIVDTQEEDKPKKQLFINIKSTCLVGYKCPLGNKAEYRTKISNNIIFSKAQSGLKRPAEIYQIADLMMPGAKKLQFGGQSQKGWLSLKHNEKTYFRCNLCLSEQNLFILPSEAKHQTQCKKCIISNLRSQFDIQQIKNLTKEYRNLNKIKISKVIVQYKKLEDVKCSDCSILYQNTQIQGFLIFDQKHLCGRCASSSKYEKKVQIQVLSIRKQVYHQSSIGCSQCGVLSFYDCYFQCGKCKNHLICKQCFWKQKSEKQLQKQPEQKKPKKEIIHEWRLKFVKNSPSMKFSCYSCKSDLSIPFWTCQTCLSWSWCGKCDKGSDNIHPHFQTKEHVQYLMI